MGIKWFAVTGLIVGAAAAVTVMATASDTPSPAAKTVAVVHTVKPKTAAPACTRPTPTTAAGFTAMFARVPVSQWGGADVSISVKLSTTRSVWLYGDTLSTGRFVHSTAITQDKGCLRVSHSGAQLLPNTSASVIYWIDSATRVSGSAINVRAAQVRIGTASAWDFHLTGLYRTARVNVTAVGDATFSRWVSSDRKPATATPLTKTIMQCQLYRNGSPLATSPAASALCPNDGHSFSYNPQVHPQFKVTGGTLVTVCFNQNSLQSDLTLYRPRFFAVHL